MDHKEWQEELTTQLEDSQAPLVIKDDNGNRYEIISVSFDRADEERILMIIEKVW